MPSPFPGMDPYLERGWWPDFQLLFVGELLSTIMPRIRTKYVIEAQRREYCETRLSAPSRCNRARVSNRERPAREGLCQQSPNSASIAEPVTLTLPMPAIPIPLEPEDPDVVLDLQAVFNAVYDRAGYDYSLDYEGAVEPPLGDADAQWAKELLAK